MRNAPSSTLRARQNTWRQQLTTPIHATKPLEAPAPVLWTIAVVRVATLFWQRHQQQHRQHHSQDSMAAAVCCEVHTQPATCDNSYRQQINTLLATGRQLVEEVNSIPVPTEQRQDAIAAELNAISQQIHTLLEQEAAHLKGHKNS